MTSVNHSVADWQQLARYLGGRHENAFPFGSGWIRFTTDRVQGLAARAGFEKEAEHGSLTEYGPARSDEEAGHDWAPFLLRVWGLLR